MIAKTRSAEGLTFRAKSIILVDAETNEPGRFIFKRHQFINEIILREKRPLLGGLTSRPFVSAAMVNLITGFFISPINAKRASAANTYPASDQKKGIGSLMAHNTVAYTPTFGQTESMDFNTVYPCQPVGQAVFCI